MKAIDQETSYLWELHNRLRAGNKSQIRISLSEPLMRAYVWSGRTQEIQRRIDQRAGDLLFALVSKSISESALRFAGMTAAAIDLTE